MYVLVGDEVYASKWLFLNSGKWPFPDHFRSCYRTSQAEQLVHVCNPSKDVMCM